MNRSFLLALIHMGIVAALWTTYGLEDTQSPRAWTRTQPFDPYDLMRGRYVRLSLLARSPQFDQYITGELYVVDHMLHIRKADCCTSATMSSIPGYALLGGSVSFFIPEDIPDPSVLKPGEELWAEVTVPPGGEPRPIRLAVKSPNGAWRELPAGRR